MLGHAFSLGEMFKSIALSKMILGQECDCLKVLIRKFGGRAEDLSKGNWSKARTGIDRALRAGAPAILGSDPVVRWLLVGGKISSGEYIWLDSADHPLTGTWTLDELKESIGEPNDGEFEALAAYPRRGADSSHSMVPHFESLHELLAEDWRLAR